MWRQDAMSGNRTPAYGGADGARTVNPYADGNRTAYGGTTASGGVSLIPLDRDFRNLRFTFANRVSTANSGLGSWSEDILWRPIRVQNSCLQRRLITYPSLQRHRLHHLQRLLGLVRKRHNFKYGRQQPSLRRPYARERYPCCTHAFERLFSRHTRGRCTNTKILRLCGRCTDAIQWATRYTGSMG